MKSPTQIAAAPILTIVGFGPGIGLAVAKRFGREGFRLALMSRNAYQLDNLAADLANSGIKTLTLTTDAGDEASVAHSFSEVDKTWGPTDVLLYNAVAVHPGPPSQLKLEDMVADFRVGVGGAVIAVQQVATSMKERGHGVILFTGGGFALQPASNLASLGISKAGLRNLAASVAAELTPHGVKVATLTVCGVVGEGGPFSPDRIASEFWNLSHEPIDSTFERLFTGTQSVRLEPELG